MDIRLLGPVEASVDGQVVAVGAGKPRALLALLALHAGSAISSERLIEGLWDAPPATALKLVQLHVSQLRKALGADAILTRGHAYELRLNRGDLDVTRFERLVAGGRPREGLGLWRGPALDDVAGEPFAAAAIRRLEEQRLAAVELAIEIDLDAGRHRAVVGELERLVLEEPLRETLHEHRMLALYRSGRQGDALEAYRQARTALVEQMGVEPGPALRQLHEAILRQDPELGPAARNIRRAAGRLVADRPRLREAEDDLAGGIVELQAREQLPLPDDGVVVCPFKGLASFDIEDAPFFFGRERLVGELVARLTGAALIGIVGASGSGKSSVLRAGLLAALAAGVLPGSERRRIALFRPGAHPLRALQEAAAADGHVLFAVDQFEELFTECRDPDERAAFAAALVAETGGRARVVIAVRADYYSRCAEYPGLARLLGAGHALIGPMRRDELRRAIELPARRAHLEVEPDLADALIADVEGEPGALPMLSTALLELWQHRDGRVLRLAAYEHLGGVHGAVARLAERAYEGLAPEQRPTARRVLERLAGEGGTRRRVPLAELESDGTVERLATERLVTIDAGTVEVAHEALLREWPRLRGWLEEDEQGRRLRMHLRDAAREWTATGREPSELYRGARLAAVLELPATELSATERDFVAASRAAGRRSQRRLRALVAGLGALLVVAVVAGAAALQQRANARGEATSAEAQRLGARALVEDDLDLSLLLARQGVALDDSPQTRANLLAALLRSPAAIGVLRGDGDRLAALDLSPDGRTLASVDNDGTLSFADVATRRASGRAVQLAGHVGFIDQIRLDYVQYSPDGSRLAVGGSDPVVVDTVSRREVARLRLQAERFVYALRFSAGGREVIAAVGYPPEGTTLQRFDAGTGAPIGAGRLVSPGLVTLLVTSDGRAVTSSSDTDTVIHDARSLRPVRRWPVRAEQAALGPDDRTLLAGGRDGSVDFVDLTTGKVTHGSGRHAAGVERAAFSPDGTRAVTAAEDGRMLVWDVAAASAGETLEGHAGQITGLVLQGTTLYTSSLDGKVLIWDLHGDRRLSRPFPVGVGDEQNPRFALSPDGRELAAGQLDGTVVVIDTRTLKARAPFRVVPTGPVRGMRYLPSGELLAIGGEEGFLALVDPRRGEIVQRLTGQRGRVYTPSVSDDGRLMATASPDRVQLYELPSGRPAGPPLDGGEEITDISLHPDGRSLALSRPRMGVEILDARTFRHRARLSASETVWDFARHSPDGRFIVGASWKGWAQLWSTETFKPSGRRFAGHASRVEWPDISPDGGTLATGGPDGTVRLWDLRTQQPLAAPLRGLPNHPVVPRFAPDGNSLFAVYGERAFRWDVRPSEWARHACAVAGRPLTRAEWRDALPGREYAPACLR